MDLAIPSPLNAKRRGSQPSNEDEATWQIRGAHPVFDSAWAFYLKRFWLRVLASRKKSPSLGLLIS
jgi:hypothetical protein